MFFDWQTAKSHIPPRIELGRQRQGGRKSGAGAGELPRNHSSQDKKTRTAENARKTIHGAYGRWTRIESNPSITTVIGLEVLLFPRSSAHSAYSRAAWWGNHYLIPSLPCTSLSGIFKEPLGSMVNKMSGYLGSFWNLFSEQFEQQRDVELKWWCGTIGPRRGLSR